ncbi:signal-induced proliferation-associated 1-like protein 1 [Aricia agestis]|uniref:signal-induced proliferation-associated 1-like protein 1 n=1 Tax=Aricia agestis TaxID=91739 RepID=UPI001C20A3B6|nr:signal-induced proliferation-associated 1-like protein 1 [Aricia agestis]
MYAPDHLKRKEARDAMYRSNSSLDLIYGEHPSATGLRREYGSHGSIDVIAGGERLPAMVHNGLATPDKPSGLTRITDRFAEVLAGDHADGPTPRASVSPKPRLKLNKLWGGASPVTPRGDSESLITNLPDTNKRKNFAHYDCQSLLANLSYAAEVRGALLSRRRNTTTGASAASLLATRGLPPGEDAVPDTGDGRSNELVESCPFFRNELGGEEERCVSLCYRTAKGALTGQDGGWHRPRAAYGFSVLEFPPGKTHWQNGCPFTKSANPLPIESQDLGALYYRNYFYKQRHQNWLGMDENLGPVAVSIKKDRVELRRGGGGGGGVASQLAWQYRLIVRTAELVALRGAVLEDAVPAAKPSHSSDSLSTKEVVEHVAPELQLACLRLAAPAADEQLLRLDEQRLTRQYKVGVMYCRAGQSTEEEMYNNREAGPAFVEFLQTLGRTVRLRDFDKYRAGLDNRTDSTGLYSVYAAHRGCEIMFHVSTMLPYTPDRQQLLRKRHVGNDIVTIVFQEPGAAAFSPRRVRSQFQHVFVVVRAVEPCTPRARYRVAVARAREVPLFGPPLDAGATYAKGEAFTDLLLSKIINAENAAIQSPKFSTMATRTRQEYLKDLARNYVTATPLDAQQKFYKTPSIFSSLLASRGNTTASTPAARADDCSTDVLVSGALCYQVQVQDEGSGSTLECALGVSADTIVLLEEASRQIVLVLPTSSLLGWVSSGGWTRIYYHVGESVRVRGAADLPRRLAAVAPPHARELQEITLARGAANELGFHVSAEGVVAGVSRGGAAARAGVRRGARLLEVCRAAVHALPHDHLVDLLKTADPVTVLLAAPAPCDCARAPPAQQQPRRRPPSPHRSDSEGYGTGGSGRSAASPAGAGGAVDVRRRSHDDSPRRRPRSANASSLTEELMRMMDAELGELRAGSGTPGREGGSAGGAPLPLPDAAALDWAALVHTATRAMLQICEEHQYPSLDASDPALDSVTDVTQDSWVDVPLRDEPQSQSGTPASLQESTTTVTGEVTSPSAGAAPGEACACGLAERVAALEADAASAHTQQRQLEDEVRRLKRQNLRLREESARAVWQLRHFTQWLKRTVDRH